MGVRQGMATDSLKLNLGPPCLTLLHPAGGSPLKRPYNHFRGGPPAGPAAFGHLLTFGHPKTYADVLESRNLVPYYCSASVRGTVGGRLPSRKQEHRCTAWGVERGRRRPQATCPVGGPAALQASQP
jgi:hypothetical protein